MTLKLITAPSVEPVTRAEAKLQCRIDADLTADDTRMDQLIAAARRAAEHKLQRAIITQTWERLWDAFPSGNGGIELGMPTVQSITSVSYYDTSGVLQTLSSSAYSHDADTDMGLWVLPAINTTWPDTLDTANAVRVRFVSGYGATAASVPEDIRTWILLYVEHAYRRESMPEWVGELLDREKSYL